VTLPVKRGRRVLLGPVKGWGEDAVLDGVTVDDGGLRLRPLPAGQGLVDAHGWFGGLAAPTGTAADCGGAVYVLDPLALAIRRLDPCEEFFEELPCLAGVGSRPRRVRGANGLAVSRWGDLYVADTENYRLQAFSLKGLVLRWITADRSRGSAEQPWRPFDVAVRCDGRILVTDAAHGELHVLAADGRRLAVWTDEEPGVPLKPTTHLAVDAEGRAYVVQEGREYVVVLDRDGRLVRRLMRVEEADVELDPGPRVRFDRYGRPLAATPLPLSAQGTFVSSPLDSGIFRCEWHRVALTSSVPSGASVVVDTFTSEAKRPSGDVAALPDEAWRTGQVNGGEGEGEWDCLVTSPPGRYLWLRLTLRRGADTPTVRKVSIEFPRETSMRFLPAVYGEEPESRDFTARFLSIFDATYDALTTRADEMASLFDPRSTPTANGAGSGKDFLAWLGSWLGLTLDRSLPVERRRELVRQAHKLYELRGTPEGVRLHVKIVTGAEPMVLEHFKLRRWLWVEAARLGRTSAVWGGGIVRRLQLDRFSWVGSFQLVDGGDPLSDPFHVFAHQFTVFVPAIGGVRRELVQAVVDAAKPAHTVGVVELVQPTLRVGVQSMIALDTVVGAYPNEVREGKAQLGRGALLGASPDESTRPTLRLGKRSRIGSTTLID